MSKLTLFLYNVLRDRTSLLFWLNGRDYASCAFFRWSGLQMFIFWHWKEHVRLLKKLFAEKYEDTVFLWRLAKRAELCTQWVILTKHRLRAKRFSGLRSSFALTTWSSQKLRLHKLSDKDHVRILRLILLQSGGMSYLHSHTSSWIAAHSSQTWELLVPHTSRRWTVPRVTKFQKGDRRVPAVGYADCEGLPACSQGPYSSSSLAIVVLTLHSLWDLLGFWFCK